MLIGERPLAQAVKSFERADPITLPFISPESKFDPGNLIGRLKKRFLKKLLLVKCATILSKPVLTFKLTKLPWVACENSRPSSLPAEWRFARRTSSRFDYQPLFSGRVDQTRESGGNGA